MVCDMSALLEKDDQENDDENDDYSATTDIHVSFLQTLDVRDDEARVLVTV